jgi:hypothetical protein
MTDSVDSNPSSDPHALVLQQQAKSLLDLASTDRRAAELAFEKLGFDTQLDTALTLTGDTLHEWLMLSTDFTELVRALPPEHLHQAVRLIGEEDALDLLQAASSEQMQQLTDIEWYTEGRLDRKKVRHWFELLLQLNEDEADQALQGLDLNAVAQYLRPNVKPAVDKDNLLLALHLNQRWLFTPDDMYCRDDLARRILDYLYAVDRDLFGDVLGLIIGEDEDIVEADMHAGREDRLIKRGFPALAEAEFLLEIVNASAYGITWPKMPQDGESVPAETTALQSQARARTPFLLHALAWGRARGDLGERTEREFIKESAALANSLLLAHTKDSGKPELRPESLLAVQVLASVGLEAIALGQLPIAVEKLKAFELRELFQLGWSLTREVAKDAWLLAMDERIEHAGLQRNLKWLPSGVREAVREAEDLMSWRRIAATAAAATSESAPDSSAIPDSPPKPPPELLTWPRLVRLRWGVWQAQNVLAKKAP